MIDERLLADPTVCPDCRAKLPMDRGGACGACSLPLHGPLAMQLWTVSQQAARLLEQRQEIIRRLRATAPAPVAHAAGADRVSAPAAAPEPAARAVPAATPEWSRQRVQNLLLGLGVLLLAVAAVIFVAVSWGHLGFAGRAAVMLGVTALAATAAKFAYRRGIEATAEWLSGLTVMLALLDAFALRRAGLADVDAVSGPSYWAGAFAAVALAAGIGTKVLPTRALRLSAVALGQLPIPIVTLDRAAIPDPVGLGVQALLVLLAGETLRRRSGPRDARLVLTAVLPVWWLWAALSAAATAPPDAYPASSLELIGLAAVAAVAGWLFRDHAARRHVASGAAAGAVLAGSLLAAEEALAARWMPAAAAGMVLALLAVLFGFPARWRLGPVIVGGAAAFLAFAAVLEPLALAVTGPLTWLGEPWTGSGGASARELITVDPAAWVADLGGMAVPMTLLAVAVGPVLATRLLAGRWPGPLAAATLTVPGLIALPPAVAMPFPLAVAQHIAVGTGLTLAGLAVLPRTRRLGPVPAVFAGGFLIGLALVWSLAIPVVTLVALGVAVPVAAAAIVLAPDSLRGVPTALAVGLAAAEVAACARRLDASWPETGLAVAMAAAVLATTGLLVAGAFAAGRWMDRVAPAGTATAAATYLVGLLLAAPGEGPLALALAAGLAAAVVVRILVRPPAGDATVAVFVLALVAALARWIWDDPLLVAFALALAAALLSAPAAWLARGATGGRDTLAVCAAGYGIGTLALAADPDRLWLALLAGGVAAGVVAANPSYRRAAWISAGLLAGSSWVRLALAGVTAPEPYTAPAGIALLAFGVLRRRRDPSLRSWELYGPGLGLVLIPSLLAAVTDTGLARPLLLALAALAVLLAGLARRLAAPLFLGGLTLAVDALVQLAPYLVAVYEAVPRWVGIALAGLLLVTIGATYENRLRDVRRLSRELHTMH